MDHQQIAAERILDRYLLGQLEAEEAERFEVHYLDCPECLAELETTRELLGGLRSMAAEEAVRVTVATGVAATLLRLTRRHWPALLLLLTTLWGLGTSLWLSRRLASTDHQLEVASRQLAQATAPQAVLAVLPLDALRGGPAAGAAPSRELRLGDEPGWVVLSLDLLQLHREGSLYRATLFRAGREVWRGEDLQPDDRGLLTVTVHSSHLVPGDYRLELANFSEEDFSRDVAHYGFRVAGQESGG